jgi:hypothetical protein
MKIQKFKYPIQRKGLIMSNYAKNTSVPVDRSMNQIRVLLQKEGADGVAIAESGYVAMVQFVFEGHGYKFLIHYPTDRDDKVRLTNSGKVRTSSQVKDEIEKEKRRLWRAMGLYIKAAIEAHANGLVDLKRSMMGNLILPNGDTMYGRLENDIENITVNPKLLLE